jgi:hypothetical protein
MNSAFYTSSIKEFVDQTPEAILGRLAKQNPFALDALQRNAWLSQIDFVQTQLGGLAGWIAFEFSIPRMGKRADAVLITSGIVFVLEFKVGSQHFDAAASDQAVDYALDLKNFHAGSHDRPIVPIVVATMASTPTFDLVWQSDGVASPIKTNGTDLGNVIERVTEASYAAREATSAGGRRPYPVRAMPTTPDTCLAANFIKLSASSCASY